MTTTTQLIAVVTIMLAFNIGMVMVQNSLLEVNPTGTTVIGLGATPYYSYVEGDSFTQGTNNLPENLDVESTDSTGFTDIYNIGNNWFTSDNSMGGLDFAKSIFSQPYGMLKLMNLPVSICLAFATIWYLIALITVVSWLIGR